MCGGRAVVMWRASSAGNNVGCAPWSTARRARSPYYRAALRDLPASGPVRLA